MGRIRNAMLALLAPPDIQMAGPQSIGPTTRGATPYRTTYRDHAIQPTTAPPAARQQWELYRVREESRNLYMGSPVWGAYVRFARVQALGAQFSQLAFTRLERADKLRLKKVTEWLSREWYAFQSIRGLGGTGQNLHQLAGSVLHLLLVDGDCFLTWRESDRGRVWDLHPAMRWPRPTTTSCPRATTGSSA